MHPEGNGVWRARGAAGRGSRPADSAYRAGHVAVHAAGQCGAKSQATAVYLLCAARVRQRHPARAWQAGRMLGLLARLACCSHGGAAAHPGWPGHAADAHVRQSAATLGSSRPWGHVRDRGGDLGARRYGAVLRGGGAHGYPRHSWAWCWPTAHGSRRRIRPEPGHRLPVFPAGRWVRVDPVADVAAGTRSC